MNKISFYLLFCAFSIHLNAQSSIFNKIYLDGELGLMSFGDSWGIIGATDLSAGYRITPEWAVGASLIALTGPSDCCYATASGTGLQLRFTPKQNGLMLKVESGYLLRAWRSSDFFYSFKWNRATSQKKYFRVSADWRFRRLTTGLTWASAPNQVNDYFDKANNLVFSEVFSVTAVSVHIGFALPGRFKSVKL